MNIKANLTAFFLLLFAGIGSTAIAQLRPEAQAKHQLAQAQTNINNKNWAEARKNLETILTLDIDVPAVFYYHYARTLEKTKALPKALEILTLYLNDDESLSDEFYSDALALLNTIETAIQAEQQAKREAEEKARKIAEDNRNYANYFKNGQVAEVTKDYKTAVAEYTKAVSRANPFPAQRVDAALRLADLYAKGLGVKKDEWEAVMVLRPFIANGEATAEVYYQAGQHLKARFYRTGKLSNFILTTYDGRNFVDNMGVADAYRKAHEKGHPKALGEAESLFNFIHAQIIQIPRRERSSYVGTSAYLGISELIADYNKAKGHYFVGLTYLYYYEDRTKARDYFSSSADLGNAEARAKLIELCLTLGQEHEQTMRQARPRGNKANWKEKAISEYRTAARHGSEEAAKRLKKLGVKLR